VVNQKVFDLEIYKDDIIIAGSDGFFDNIFIGYLAHYVNFLIYLSFKDNDLSEKSTEVKIVNQINDYVKYLQKGYKIFMKEESKKGKLNKIPTEEITLATRASLFLENYQNI
jgi:hypothetical protein